MVIKMTQLTLARNAVVAATGAALLLGEASERYDDAHRVTYAAQNLRRHMRSSNSSGGNGSSSDAPAAQEQQQQDGSTATSTAWLAKDAPKFPYLLGISPGDNPAKVASAVLDGSKVIGSFSESTSATLRDLTTPSSVPEQWVSALGQRWKALKASLHADLPAEFDPRVSALTSTLGEILEALKEIEGSGTSASDTASNLGEEPNSQPPPVSQSQEQPYLVFFLGDFDDLSTAKGTKDAEIWMQWIHKVTSSGLAHVVMPTRAGVTPTKLDALQALHGAENGDFVAIVLRVAKGVADATSAEDKLRELEDEHGLGLRMHNPELDKRGDSLISKDDEVQIILDAVGNWWSDLVAIFDRLKQHDLASVTVSEERVALIRTVCEELRQDAMASILSQIHLDGSLDLLNVASSSKKYNDSDQSPSHLEEEKALRALESWKCLEVVAGMAAKSGLMASPQQFLMKDTQKPLNCVHPVEALLPFGHRKEGETKFLQLIDENILFLRPKADVEIGVVPCALSDLIAPCWIETRPVIASAFKKIWLREEIELYAQEIDERRQLLAEQKAEFLLMQFTFTKAERATRTAEPPDTNQSMYLHPVPAPVQNVLVLGAGELGMSVLRAFAEKRDPNTRVTVMLRPGSIDSPDETKQRDQRAIRDWGFNILPFDVSATTAAELSVAMERFDLVISCTGFSAGAGTQVKIAQAVLAARVKKFVPWQFGVDYDRIGRGSAQDLFDEQLQVRDLLRNQRERETDYTPTTQWKIISTGIFCSFLFEPWFGIVEPQHSGHEIVVRALGSWENAVTVTTVEDIGTLTVEVILSPEIEWDSVTFVAGDTITYGDLARFVQEAAAAGSPSAVQTEVWSSSYLEKELLKDPTSAISKYRVAFAAGVGVSWDKKDTWNARNGVKTTSVTQWLAAHLSVLAHQEV